MSDSHIYELQDIVWDDFSVSSDHLVPHPQIERNGRSAVQGEMHKKLKHEVGMTESSHESECVCETAEKASFSIPETKKKQMGADGSWPQNPNDFSNYNDLMTRFSSEGTSMSSDNFQPNNKFCAGDATPYNNCTASNNHTSYSTGGLAQTENDLSFLYNGHGNKETDDIMSYEWPDIGNFEDVEQMLRTCDSTFELRDVANENEMCWYSSSTSIDGSEAASKLDVRSSHSDPNPLKMISENNESPHPNYESTTVDTFNRRSAGVSCSSSILKSNTTEQASYSKASSTNGLRQNSDQKDKEKSIKEVNMSKRSMGYQNQSGGNTVSHSHFDGRKQSSNPKLSFGESPQQMFSINGSGLQKQSETSNKSCVTGEASPEETSFRQLQEVMEQLDIRTKLCIRDSLYRLARSAEQRHAFANMKNGSKAERNSNEALMAETKHAGLLDIETDTNPIDRSIAHLLFHRPSDPSTKPASNMLPAVSLSDGVAHQICQDFIDAK